MRSMHVWTNDNQAHYHPRGKVKPHWTDAELRKLVWLYDRYENKEDAIQRIAKTLNRSEHGVRIKAQTMGLFRKPDGVETLGVNQIAALFCRDHTSVLDWVKRGTFGKLIKPHKNVGVYRVKVDDLWEWMEKPATWHLWEPETLTDKETCIYFTDLRAGWIDAGQAGNLLNCQQSHVNKLRSRGAIPGMGFKRCAWYRIEDIHRYREGRQEMDAEDVKILLTRAKAMCNEMDLIKVAPWQLKELCELTLKLIEKQNVLASSGKDK
jgi:hypothetical protein